MIANVAFTNVLKYNLINNDKKTKKNLNKKMNNSKENSALNKPAVIGSCCEIATKKRGFIYADEECGNKAKIEIEYTLNNKYVKKQLCMKHYKSVTAWLDRIKVSYNCL